MRYGPLLVLGIVGLVAQAEAGVLAPSKPSQTLILRPGAACSASSVALDTRVNPDGTTAPFGIPAKQVLVLDSITWTVLDAAIPGGLCGIVLRVGNQVIWTDNVTQANASASCSQTTALPNLVIPSGQMVCIGVGAGGTVNSGVTRVHGFLTKAK